jgi:gamma-glutamyltranspeptidase/glutathione hydrolase
VAVPGAPDLCITALKLLGTMSLEQVARPTLELLSGGTEWEPGLARTIERMIHAEKKCPGLREEKLQAAADRFYRGDIAAELEEWYMQSGGFLRRTDLAAHTTRVENAVSAPYRGLTVCKCGTWTQGPMLLQALRLLDGFDIGAMRRLSAEPIHVAIEALKLAMADRDMWYGDPLFAGVPLAALLCDEYTGLRRPLIDPHTAHPGPRPGDPLGMKALRDGGAWRPAQGGTTTCVAADRWGNVVAATPSCNDTRGDKGIDLKTGVAHGSRLTSLNTLPGHPNCIAPGKRPRITLTPTLILEHGRPLGAISVAGGDWQDQTTLNVILNAVDFRLSAADAVVGPRFATELLQDSFSPSADRKSTMLSGSLLADPEIISNCGKELREMGHTLKEAPFPVGNPVMLWIEQETGTVHAAGDPEAKRHAAAV